MLSSQQKNDLAHFDLWLALKTLKTANKGLSLSIYSWLWLLSSSQCPAGKGGDRACWQAKAGLAHVVPSPYRLLPSPPVHMGSQPLAFSIRPVARAKEPPIKISVNPHWLKSIQFLPLSINMVNFYCEKVLFIYISNLLGLVDAVNRFIIWCWLEFSRDQKHSNLSPSLTAKLCSEMIDLSPSPCQSISQITFSRLIATYVDLQL